MKCPKCKTEMISFYSQEYYKCKKCDKVVLWGSEEDLKLKEGVMK